MWITTAGIKGDFEMKRRIKSAVISAGLVSLLALSACSASGGRPDSQGDAAAGGQVATTARLKVAMVTHGAPGDAFFDVVRKGAETAASKDNVEFLYAADPEGSKQSQFIQQYVDQKVDGLIVALANPLAVQDVLAKAKEAGIPVVSINAGESYSAKFGALAHYGSNDRIAGEAVGEELAKMGFKHPICLNQQQGAINLEERCAGIKSKVGGTETLYVQGTDMTDVSSKVTSKLQATPDADVIVGNGAAFTLTAVKSVKESGSKTKVAAFDLSEQLAQAIIDGDIEFTVDQQPYLQGYEAVDGLWLNKVGGFALGGGKAVLTGPKIITKSEASSVLENARKGLR
jgi:simple sugar transport system substrate-binding protein